METLLTFCPPGPEARKNSKATSAGGIEGGRAGGVMKVPPREQLFNPMKAVEYGARLLPSPAIRSVCGFEE